MQNSVKNLAIIVIGIIVLIILISCTNTTNSELINEKVHSIGGEVLDIELKSYIFSNTPFSFSSKFDTIYRFTYLFNGEEKIGWFRKRVFSDDWIFDYKKD